MRNPIDAKATLRNLVLINKIMLKLLTRLERFLRESGKPT